MAGATGEHIRTAAELGTAAKYEAVVEGVATLIRNGVDTMPGSADDPLAAEVWNEAQSTHPSPRYSDNLRRRTAPLAGVVSADQLLSGLRSAQELVKA
jgi:hypothetical protein